ncbi:hypothetical protein TMEN_1925 [Trichophyton mentagrophytes]|nr:hypothetical protein TMEN_1925 [Trichophyton mentagrophytes]
MSKSKSMTGDEVDDEIEVDGGGDDGVDVDIDIEVAVDVDVGVGADSDDGECRAVLAPTLESVKVTRYARERKQFPVVLSFA